MDPRVVVDYRVVEFKGANAEPMQQAFNDLAKQGFIFKAFVPNFGTAPAGASAIAVFEKPKKFIAIWD